MDILHLVDRLEELFNSSRPLPFSKKIMVDEERFLEIIDQMRISIPEEVKKSQQLTAQRDRILAQAQEEANRTIALAKQRAEGEVDKDAIVKGAQTRADQIIDQARIDADDIRNDADEYVIEALASVEAELARLLNQARNGIAKLSAERQKTLDAEEPQPSPGS
jgi:cell division septum initiation protein DivIVA